MQFLDPAQGWSSYVAVEVSLVKKRSRRHNEGNQCLPYKLHEELALVYRRREGSVDFRNYHNIVVYLLETVQNLN